MNRHTQQQLLELNRQFYKNSALEFAATRTKPWPGWIGLLPWIREEHGSLLDVGSGNGRFGAWIKDHRPNLVLHGLEPEPKLSNKSSDYQHLYPLELPLDASIMTRHYDVIVLFGVLHHLPSFEMRLAQLQTLGGLVNSGGVLIVTLWQPLYGPLASKIPDQKHIAQVHGIDAEELESNDLLLGFQHTEAIRYCHHFDFEEQSMIGNSLELDLISSYCADGFTGRDNVYLIWKKR